MIKIRSIRREVGNETPKPQLEDMGSIETGAHRPRSRLWVVALVSLIFFVFSLSYLFGKAEVKVNPKFKDVVLSESLSASKDANTDSLPFDLVVISGEESKEVASGEEKDISLKAKGTVVIYNNFGFSSQALDIDTRLEGSNGKIYKTVKRIVVPGKPSADKPGSIEIGIYATEAGQEYNSLPLDFKIFGFRGTPKYSKFYARSKGDITGGFKGKTKVIPDSLKATVLSELKNNLKAKLLKKVTDQIPSGFILFKDAIFLNIDNSVDIPLTGNDILEVKIKGTLYGFLFDEKKLTDKIAKNNIENYDGSEMHIPKIRDLNFFLSTELDSSSFKDLKNINFNLKGNAKIVWSVDTDKLAAELLSRSKKDFNQILSAYPNIDSATLTLSPIWKRSIPDKLKDVKVIVNYPE